MSEADFQAELVNIRPIGGQQVGVTQSVVKVTHIPTGLYAVCGTERSQHRARAVAKAMVEYGLAEIGWRAVTGLEGEEP